MTLPTKLCLPYQALLLTAAGLLSGCVADSARPGAVCGHCDYRFSHQTPNPCDDCVPEIVLPGYGHTPTSWQIWPEHVVETWREPAMPGALMEEVMPPHAAPPQAAPPQAVPPQAAPLQAAPPQVAPPPMPGEPMGGAAHLRNSAYDDVPWPASMRHVADR